jgi:UDP-N-acetylglucosamine 4,6-dehydratase
MFNKKTILVTGGTGSFGTSFVENVLKKYKPKKLIIFSRDEYKQFLMQEKLAFHPQKKNIRFFIGDVRDSDRLDMAFRDVDYVVHAAAMKQIPATEKEPLECIKTNIYGATNVIKSALKNKVKKVIALSTDKAVNPINLYGATKLAADKLFVSANHYSGNIKTIFSVVRYGNVIGSRGSVIPYFKKLKEENNKYLPITHTDMTRFVISIEDAVNFVIKSFVIMKGREIFIPILPSVKIIDLARAINPKANLKITGIRQGEKIHESLFSLEESRLVRKLNGMYILYPEDLKNIKQSTDKEYNSGTNSHFLKYKEILKII